MVSDRYIKYRDIERRLPSVLHSALRTMAGVVWRRATATVLCITWLSLFIFYRFQSISPYMDEIFHIPQAQHYCNNEFHIWNKGITTFPGLYLWSYAVRFVVGSVIGEGVVECTPTFLRFTNLAISISLPILFDRCRRETLPLSGDSWMISLALYLYPFSFFYYFLYYTDTLSTASIVLLYLFSIRRSKSLAVKGLQLLLTICSILARQTNAVWVMFIVGTTMLEFTIQNCRVADRYDNFPHSILLFVVSVWKHKVELLDILWPYLVPVVAFVLFVIRSGSIVLGDKDNHRPVMHYAMIGHALLLVGLMISLTNFSQFVLGWKNIAKTFTFDMRHTVISSLVSGALLWGSYSHPFLESDNRHYTFYVWKRILSHKSMRYMLCPVYSVATCFAFDQLSITKGPIWVTIYFVALFLSLVPTPLLEPRYFTPAVVFALLNCPRIQLTSPLQKLFGAAALSGLVLFNLLILYVFIARPFTWPDGSIARFMY